MKQGNSEWRFTRMLEEAGDRGRELPARTSFQTEPLK
jgi:hypothetical protein